MNLSFGLFIGTAVTLLLLLAWLLGAPKKRGRGRTDPLSLQETRSRHITHVPQIRQALAKADYEFVSTRVSKEAQRRMRRERRHVALAYLSALHDEFEGLLHTARIIAALSPEVHAVQELERIQLTVKFHWRYRIIWMSLWLGYAPLPQISDLSNLLSGYSVRLETAIKELGERAALLGELVSSADRRRVNPV